MDQTQTEVGMESFRVASMVPLELKEIVEIPIFGFGSVAGDVVVVGGYAG
jgi:hypothetical protein